MGELLSDKGIADLLSDKNTLALVVGAIFLLIGLLGGGLRVFAIIVPPLSKATRILLGVVGVLFFALGFVDGGSWLRFRSTPSATPVNTPSSSPVPSPTVPITPTPCGTTRRMPVTVRPLTFIPPKIGKGDANFAHHGPCVSFRLTLSLDAPRTELRAKYSMDAYECDNDKKPRRDFTHASGDGHVVLFKVPDPGDRIVGFDVDDHAEQDYIDISTEPDVFSFPGASPVEQLVFVGDTDGDAAGTKTKVDIYFRSFDVQVENCH